MPKLTTIHKLMPNPAKQKWNTKYQKQLLDGKNSSPSKWLIEHKKSLEERSSGTALDLACGAGGNSLYLASLGFKVEAIDISDVVINWLKREVSAKHLSISPILADLEDLSLDIGKYDVILNFNYLQRSLFPSIVKWLKPGGLLFFETMNVDHIDKLNNKFERSYLLEKNELEEAFSKLKIIAYKELIIKTINGTEKSVSRLLATK